MFAALERGELLVALPELLLNPRLQPAAYRPIFARFGRLHVPDFLQPQHANALQAQLLRLSSWHRSVHVDAGSDIDVPVEEWEELSPPERALIEQGIHDRAGRAFQYVFDTVRVREKALDDGGEPALAAAMKLVNSAAFLGFVRTLTGDDRPVFGDAMFTRYLPGHFLTAHDDEAEEGTRLYAYVLNLTPSWRADWGGLLLFLDEEDHVEEGYVPAFNALNIFRVPQRHAVSFVTPFAQGPRLSVTGWIRSRVPDWRRKRS